MKKTKFIFLLSVSSIFLYNSCNKDDDKTSTNLLTKKEIGRKNLAG